MNLASVLHRNVCNKIISCPHIWAVSARGWDEDDKRSRDDETEPLRFISRKLKDTFAFPTQYVPGTCPLNISPHHHRLTANVYFPWCLGVEYKAASVRLEPL